MNKRLLLELMRSSKLAGYITRTSDEHLNEFIHESDKKVRFLTGFSGSQGTAITSEKESVLYTDARYFLQAEQELSSEYKLMRENVDGDMVQFLRDNFSGVKKVGIPLRQFPSKKYEKLKRELENLNADVDTIAPVERDLVDIMWRSGRPRRKYGNVVNLEKIKLKEFLDKRWIRTVEVEGIVGEENVTGSSYVDKLSDVSELINDDEGMLISDLNTIAWLFNLRGSDIEYQSVFYSYAYITKSSTILFTNADLDAEKGSLEGVRVYRYDGFEEFLKEIRGNKIVVSGDCNAYIRSKLDNVRYTDEVDAMKSVKTDAEVIGFELAGTMDGVALTKLFAWLDGAIDDGVSEKQVSDKLLELKRSIKGFVTPSFSSIVAAGENGAILHHEAGRATIRREDLILTDSGSHYYYGTTDISRTVHFGSPRSEMKRDFTLVLKGAINARMLSRGEIDARDIDKAARKYLNGKGLDYKTATGHGVGHFLSVHENPPLISKNDRMIEEDQVFTIEPGLSREGEYGIRIEDMVVGVKSGSKYGMETLSFVPLCLDLIDTSMLDGAELKYVNEYSEAVFERLSPYFSDDKSALRYLERNTRKLKR